MTPRFVELPVVVIDIDAIHRKRTNDAQALLLVDALKPPRTMPLDGEDD